MLDKTNLKRHEHACHICNHPQRDEIESDFIAWHSPKKICEEFQLGDRSKIYRHARATGLDLKRRKNVAKALEKIIEQCEGTTANSSAIVLAVQTLSKLNSEGRMVERRETVNLNQLWEKMSAAELLEYAETGVLPSWFTEKVEAI